ncbi:MAG: RcnB family protein [Hyphomonadaceae bacterium]|nr:RcnB family protein [Hyphomonadaceae bacterium]
MRRIATAALAAATFIAPLAAAGTAAADNGRHRGWDRHDRDRDNWDDRRDEARAYHQGYRDARNNDWDDRRYNGYWYNSRFYYGPPPSYHPRVVYGYQTWRRGERLPPYYASRYRPVDYRVYHVAPPPRGYHYVRDDNRGELLLVGITTGVILGAILASN